MVNFVIGRSGTGKSTFVCDEIVREIREGEREIVLIVPEQQTVVWETRMARLLPPSANFRLEITNFTRLANSVFREFGGLADKVVDEGTRSLLIWRAMVSVWEQLRVYNHCASGREDRNIPYLMSAVDELKNSGITPEMAEKALDALITEQEQNEKSRKNAENSSENLTKKSVGGDLISRLSDAVLVYSAYNSMLHEEYIDRGDLLDNLAKTLSKNDYFHNKAVYIDSFFSLTSAEERILSQIMKQAEDVTITFTCQISNKFSDNDEITNANAENGNMDDGEAEFYENEEIQFKEIKSYLRTATSLAIRAGQEIKKIELNENLRHKNSPELALVEKYLFNYSSDIPDEEIANFIEKNNDGDENEPDSGEKGLNKAKNIEILTCTDLYDEAEACASIVDKLIRDGYKYSEIAVVARNIKTREGVVDSVLRKHGVRYFISETSDASNLPAVRFILSALAVETYGWQRKDIIALLKSGLTLVGKEIAGINEEIDGYSEQDEIPINGTLEEDDSSKCSINTELEGDIFELYTETWNIRGKKAYTSGAWSMNPAGYKTERTEVGEEMLRLANSAREKLVKPLEKFLSVFENGSAEVREIAESIVQYAEDCDILNRLNEYSEAYKELGLLADAQKTVESWDKVCEILDKIVETLGETKLDAGRFAGLFARVANSMDVGTIPTGVDEIILGSSSGVRFDDVKCVIILGALDGEFPASVAETNAFFGENDKILLESVGLDLDGINRTEQTAREHFMFYRTVSAATDALYVLAPSSDSQNLSEGAKRIEQILDKIGRKCTNKFAEKCVEDVIYAEETAEYLINRRSKSDDLLLINELNKSNEVKIKDFDLSAEKVKLKKAQKQVLENVQNSEAESKDLQKTAFKNSRMTLSQTKIETFVSCPFRYWCKYQMKLSKVPKAEIKNPDIGTFIHEVLEKFFSGLTQEQMQNLPLSDDETEKIADEIIEKYVNRLATQGLGVEDINGKIALDGRLAYLFLRLKRHIMVFLKAIMREFAQSEFKPVAFEKPIGIKSGIEPLKILTESGVEIVLRGVADRIDEYTDQEGRKFVRIVDYKTGSKTFSIDDIKRGINVQLLIYLFSVCGIQQNEMNKNTEVLPAGAVYFQAKPSVISKEKLPIDEEAVEIVISKIERSGAILADEDVIKAMDKEMDGKIIKAKLDSTGNLKEMQKSTSLLSLEEFGKLEAELEEVIGKIGDRIINGEANAIPMTLNGKKPCEYCENRYICKNVNF